MDKYLYEKYSLFGTKPKEQRGLTARARGVLANPLHHYLLFGIVMLVVGFLSANKILPYSLQSGMAITFAYSLASVGFCLLMGYSGLASLGTGGFMGIGSYSIHFIMTESGLPFGVALVVALAIGVVLGLISGYFGGVIDDVIMRICDILMCLPGFPILLIISTLLDAANVAANMRIYFLMAFLTLFSWPGTARLVRGQILFLREQEYMVAAEAMGYSTSRKIFKHLIPNVMPQLIVSMTLSLGSMILYEASLSYLNMGVRAPFAAWGTMINIVAEDSNILQNFFNVWGPPGVCIIIAVLGFNFVGDGLRDAFDPKLRS